MYKLIARGLLCMCILIQELRFRLTNNQSSHS